MIPVDFGVFDLSIYPFSTGVRKSEEKSEYDKKNFLSLPLPLATVWCKPLLCCNPVPCTGILSGSKEGPKENAHDVAQHV
jgi:hypothetical protein